MLFLPHFIVTSDQMIPAHCGNIDGNIFDPLPALVPIFRCKRLPEEVKESPLQYTDAAPNIDESTAGQFHRMASMLLCRFNANKHGVAECKSNQGKEHYSFTSFKSLLLAHSRQARSCGSILF